MKKIVVGTDFSEPSEIAVEQAMHIARHTGASLTLVHAGQPKADADVPDSLVGVEEFDTLVEESAAENRTELDALRERLSGSGVDVSQAVVEGFPDTVLCEVADDVNADLLVTGTHGRSGLKRILLGSVAERVVRLSRRPVLVARNNAGAGGFKRILVPIDFSPTSERAVEVAMSLAAPDATVELFHCWQLPPQGRSTRAQEAVLKPILRAVEADVAERGSKLTGRLATADRTISFHSMREVPAQGIEDRLREHDYDIVVMGSHGRRGLRRFLLGSVAEATVRHANCSVLIVWATENSDG